MMQRLLPRVLPLLAVVGLALASPMVMGDDKAPKTPAPKAPPAASAPEKPKPIESKPAAPAAPASGEDLTKAGAMHALLAPYEGEFDADMSEMGADGKMSSNSGTISNKLAYAGRFLEMTYKGRQQGRFFYGYGVLGYNNAAQRFESSWYDSGNTAMMFFQGPISKDLKTITLTGETFDPAGKKGTARLVIDLLGKDAFKETLFLTIEGKEHKQAEISYTRAKGESKGENKAENKADNKGEGKKDDKPADKPEVKKDDKPGKK